MLLDIRIRLAANIMGKGVEKPQEDVSQSCEIWGRRSSLAISKLSMRYLSPVSCSIAFLKQPWKHLLACFQGGLVCLFFVVCVARFHASLPTLQILLVFIPGEVRCQILYVFKHKRNLPMMLLFSLLKLPLQPWLFFPFCPPPSE